MNSYYNSHSNPYPQENALALRVSQIMKRVYFQMFLAMIVSGITAWFCASSPSVITFFALHRWSMWVLFAIELILVMSISSAVNRLSASTATLLFYLFAIVNGVTLFPIVAAFSGVSIAKTFFITAGVFGAMSVYGYFTNRDLSRWGSILVMCLFGLIIASVVNIFLHSTTMDWIVSCAGVIIFIGLTAWDTQQVKNMALAMPGEFVPKLAIIGALTLYLDFINLFLMLLNFFGSSRDS
ncbi:MAG: Bax inhibitor-1/YccA family protein [Firmicutes bacterium]|nr:Bax inhibitor-1/YccA family protein [Bacillota bacterium]MCM1400482.1 Bax inhibitor-1/YccA family protein [Bacteroides sp.]MCM1477453.1 Bax inhibitor-1/YccA family protein [Bacteroides sp.]